jgi:hypothetical protein
MLHSLKNKKAITRSGDGLWLNASFVLATSPAYGRQKDADRQQQQAKQQSEGHPCRREREAPDDRG